MRKVSRVSIPKIRHRNWCFDGFDDELKNRATYLLFLNFER